MSKRWIIRLVLIALIAIIGIFALSLREFTGNDRYEFRVVAEGLREPTSLANLGEGRFLVTERFGTVRLVDNGTLLETPFLDLTDLVQLGYIEQGLLGIAVDPNFAENGAFYVHYNTGEAGQVQIARFFVQDDNPNQADIDTQEILLTVEQPNVNHNGGQLLFGPDGMLYIGLGDGGDPSASQDTSNLLGTILRIDVSTEPYSIPADNPFVDDESALPEIWAYGLRNPWRFSFDRDTGDMYIGDVGAEQFEEINRHLADSPAGQNYGWDIYQAFMLMPGQDESDEITMPIFAYPHNKDGVDYRLTNCAISGGFVYRGDSLPDLQGIYIYGDWCSGAIWTLQQDEAGEWVNEEFMQTPLRINSFGEDEAGELYMLSQDGKLWKLFAR